jgi:hypothetical protein
VALARLYMDGVSASSDSVSRPAPTSQGSRGRRAPSVPFRAWYDVNYSITEKVEKRRVL